MSAAPPRSDLQTNFCFRALNINTAQCPLHCPPSFFLKIFNRLKYSFNHVMYSPQKQNWSLLFCQALVQVRVPVRSKDLGLTLKSHVPPDTNTPESKGGVFNFQGFYLTNIDQYHLCKLCICRRVSYRPGR